MNKIQKTKKKLLSFIIISSVLLIPLLILASPNITKTNELDIDVTDDVSIEPKTSAIVDGTMTVTMFPIVISYDTYSDIYEKLEFKDYSMIRVGYYGESDEWEWVPYQIDEIGEPYVWGDKATDIERAMAGTGFPELLRADKYIPFGDPNGRGFDQYIPGALDFNDELVFYAYNGRQVDQSMWGLPEFEHRIELEIQDGSGGTGWMYIYTSDSSHGNNSIAHESWYEDYVSFNEDNLEIETDVYKLNLHPQNFDLFSSLKIKGSNDPTNLIDEYNKQNTCANVIQSSIPFFYSGTEGTWGSTSYSKMETALDDPSDEYNYDGERAENNLAYGPTENNDISNKGDHKASCDGPIRVILQFPNFQFTEQGQIQLGPLRINARGFSQGSSTVKFYYDRMETGGGGDRYEVQTQADFCVLYTYKDIVSLNNDIRNNLTVYYGADPASPYYGSFTSGLKTCNPDGNGGNDDYNSGGVPLQGASSDHPENTDLGDWLMVTSDEFGGFWKYLGREAYDTATGVDQTNVYWLDTPGLTEMGMHFEKYGNGMLTETLTLDSFTRTTIFGNFSSSNVNDGIGITLFDQEELRLSNTLITHVHQDKPNMPFFVSISADQTSYKNGSTITFNIKCDDDNYTIYGDFSEVDSNFNEGNVNFQNLGNDLYKINYTISSDNTKVPGKYYVNLTADDGHPSSENNTQQKYIAYYTHDETFLNITSVVTQPSITDVYPGQTYYAAVNITNPTFFDVTINSLSLDFTYFNDEWGNAKTNFTNGSPTPTMPYTIPENTTSPITFNLSFSLDANSPPGLVSVNSSIERLTIIYTEDTFSHNGSGSPCVVNVIDNTAPNLPRRPGNLTLVEGSAPSNIYWTWFDYKPAYFNITEDGAFNKSTTLWYSGIPIEHKVSANHLGIGTFNYTIHVNDTSNNAAWSDVKVEVTSADIAISEEYDVVYTYGNNVPNLTWTPSWDPGDGAPGNYTIKKNGIVVQSGSWDSSGITYDIVTGFWVGNYTIECNISNVNGDSDIDTVKVTVLNDIPELSSSHVTLLDDTTYVSGSIGNKLVWTVSDSAYNGTLNSYNVTRNGEEWQTNTWVADVPIDINIDGLSAATYNFSIYVEDGLGGTVFDSVLVRVLANNAPEIEISYDKLEFEEGTTAVEIRWEITDKYYNSSSCSYTITINSTLDQSGTWQIIGDAGYIIYAFDNHTQLEIGYYNFLLTVNDGYGGEETHLLIVQVKEKIYYRPITLFEQLLTALKPIIAFLSIVYVGRVIQKRRRISVKKVKLVDPVYHSERGIKLEKRYDTKDRDELILDDSIRQFKYASMIDPKLPEPHYNLAIALMEKGQITESIAEFKKVLSLNPEFAEAHNNLGIALCLNGEFEEAIASFEEALKINPDFTEAKSNLETAREDKDGEYWSRFGVR